MTNFLVSSELDRMATKIERWADIDRGNIEPTEEDALVFDFELEDFEPEYINREQYYARKGDAQLLRRRAIELRERRRGATNEVRSA